MVQITTLMDDAPSENKALLHEHGLSYLIETDTSCYLFDCGSGPAIFHNAHRLGKDLKKVDSVILSHSHYDHAAGYRDFAETTAGKSILYTGAHFFEPKYAQDGIRMSNLSAGFDKDFLTQHSISHQIVEDVTQLTDGIWLVGNFPRIYKHETIPSRFVKYVHDGQPAQKEQLFAADSFEDEICMVIESSSGLVVLAGCSHPGICNMIDRIYKHFQKQVYAVFGGTHLIEADKLHIQTTLEQLKDFGLQIIGLSHCSGQCAEQFICADPSVQSCHLAVGDTIFL